ERRHDAERVASLDAVARARAHERIAGAVVGEETSLRSEVEAARHARVERERRAEPGPHDGTGLRHELHGGGSALRAEWLAGITGCGGRGPGRRQGRGERQEKER